MVTLTDLIVQSQNLMRLYASEQLRELKMKPEDVEVCVFVCLSFSVCMYICICIYMYITIREYDGTLCRMAPEKNGHLYISIPSDELKSLLIPVAYLWVGLVGHRPYQLYPT